jgi:hypothetical protein
LTVQPTSLLLETLRLTTTRKNRPARLTGRFYFLANQIAFFASRVLLL